MRLTLRTLLAWLDGIVSSGESEDLAAKISASTAAGTVIDRIRAVVASPAIDAARIDARGMGDDANSVAEYLTNALPADSVAAFERVCIDSDSRLAEVAACHRMLAEVAADPSIIEAAPADLVDRLCRRIGVGGADRFGGVQEMPATPPTAIPVSGRSAVAPLAAEPISSSRRWLPYASIIAAVALVAALATGLGWSLWRQGTIEGAKASAPRSGEPTPREPDPTNPENAATVAVKPPEAPPPARDPPIAPDSTPSSSPAADRVPGGDAVAIAAVPDRAETQARGQVQGQAQGQAPGQGQAAGLPAAPVPSEPPPTLPVESTEPQPPDADDFVVGPAALFLRQNPRPPGPESREDPPEAPKWEAVAPGAGLSGRQDLLVPPGLAPTLSIGSATLHVDQSSRVVVSREPDGSFRLEVVFGRAALTGIDAAATVHVLAGGLSGRASGNGGAPIVIETLLSRPPGADAGKESAEARFVESSVAFPQGGTWRPDDPSVPSPAGLGDDGKVPAGSTIRFAGHHVGDLRDASGIPRLESGGGKVASLDWLSSSPADDRLVRSSGLAMALGVAERPLPAALDRLLADSRSENRAAAAATWALLGEYVPLMQVLGADEPGWRLPATLWETLERSSVSLALARGERSAERFRGAVMAEAPAGTAELVIRLAEGFSDAELADGGDRTLVEALGHPALVVRRFAHARLLDIVQPAAADGLRFRPDAGESARAEGGKWWRKQLEKGLIRRPAAGGLSKPADE